MWTIEDLLQIAYGARIILLPQFELPGPKIPLELLELGGGTCARAFALLSIFFSLIPAA